MKLYCLSHPYRYELEKLVTLFYPLEPITVRTALDGDAGDCLVTALEPNGDAVTATARLTVGGRVTESSGVFGKDANWERELALLAFDLLTAARGFTPQWGILTGVRPVKLMLQKTAEYGEAGAVRYFEDVLRVSPQKTELARTVAASERAQIDSVPQNAFSLYVSVPFCPSRCRYCSFVSHSVGTPAAQKLVPEYVDRLCDELRLTAAAAREAGLSLVTVYWGGGTPTTFTAAQLDRVLGVIEREFDLSACREYTVEAGRPDTVTREKLTVLHDHGVGRISVNPQTFSDGVLRAIGRRHTVADTERAYALARDVGFDVINMDLIAGLPTDTPEGFENSVSHAVELGAENVTVHSLALKRSSALVTEHGEQSLDFGMAPAMIDTSRRLLTAAGYAPYYLYRQSRSLGNLENVGWCKPGTACLYNVLMMEEPRHILAVGAGAVTKLVRGDTLERVCNFKYPFEYNSRFALLAERKKRINAFFSE